MPECIYCNVSKRRRDMTDEHIVPQVMGGTRVLKKRVCPKCNNEELSSLDSAVGVDSHIGMVAAREWGSRISHLWSVDHSVNNLLLEGVFDPKSDSVRLYPQLIFEASGTQIRGEGKEMYEFGPENFQKVFFENMVNAFRDSENGIPDRVHFEKINHPLVPGFYRLPPRIFIPRSITELDAKSTFVVRYTDDDAKRFARNCISKWQPSKRFNTTDYRNGTYSPPVRVEFNPHKVLRGLMKIGFNLLVQECPNTPVNENFFPEAVGIILGKYAVTPTLMEHNGFVPPSLLQSMNCKEGHHKFWIMFENGFWTIHTAFFGGKICTSVTFPGTNKEKWTFRSVEVPFNENTNTWSRADHLVHPELQIPIVWKDALRICPSVPLTNYEEYEITVPIKKKVQNG